MASMLHLQPLTLDSFCTAVHSVGYQVAFTALADTLIAERGPEVVIAKLNRDGTVSATKANGDFVSLAELLRTPTPALL